MVKNNLNEIVEFILKFAIWTGLGVAAKLALDS